MKIDWLDKLRFFLQVMAFCLAISALQYAFRPERPYEVPLLYSVLIGGFTWAIIDFGRHFFASSAERGWPQGAAGIALPLVGILLGYGVGITLADAWFGWSSWDANARPQLRVSLLISAVSGLAATYFFYARGKSAYLIVKIAEAGQLAAQAGRVAAQAQQHAAESKLKLLETQLEPHMLFNTLANLRALISTEPQQAQVMMDHLINYLRATLKASRATLHPLQTEFDRLRDYLELMAVRMGPRLHYTLDLPPELANESVPTLLLQPLVENSIRHGLEPKLEGGSITVQARRSGGSITLEVIDTGVGMGALGAAAGTEDAQGTQHAAHIVGDTHGASSGFGLAQVRERLATAYGTDGTINIIANYEYGTRATVIFPSQMTQK